MGRGISGYLGPIIFPSTRCVLSHVFLYVFLVNLLCNSGWTELSRGQSWMSSGCFPHIGFASVAVQWSTYQSQRRESKTLQTSECSIIFTFKPVWLKTAGRRQKTCLRSTRLHFIRYMLLHSCWHFSNI